MSDPVTDVATKTCQLIITDAAASKTASAKVIPNAVK